MRIIALLVCLYCSALGLKAEDGDTTYPGVKGTDAQIYQRLTGTWVGKTMGFQGTLVYKANGQCTSDLVPVDFFMKLVANPYSFSGTWEIKHGYLWSTVAVSNSHAIKPGTRYRNELLLLTKDTFTTRNEKNMVLTFKRKG